MLQPERPPELPDLIDLLLGLIRPKLRLRLVVILAGLVIESPACRHRFLTLPEWLARQHRPIEQGDRGNDLILLHSLSALD